MYPCANVNICVPYQDVCVCDHPIDTISRVCRMVNGHVSGHQHEHAIYVFMVAAAVVYVYVCTF